MQTWFLLQLVWVVEQGLYSHVIARAAKELNILTVGVVTLFLYRPSRMKNCTAWKVEKHVDTIIVVPNQNLFKIANEQTTFEESFNLSNNVLSMVFKVLQI